MNEWKTNYVIMITIIIINSPPPQDPLANTRTRSLAAQPPFLRLQNVSVCIEVSTGAEKLRTVILGFSSGVSEICALLGFHAK
jgi:hypothetical protein